MQRGSRSERAIARARSEILERLEAIPIAIEGLKRVCPSLGALFEDKFGEESAVMKSNVAPDVYRRFFIQVSSLLR